MKTPMRQQGAKRLITISATDSTAGEQVAQSLAKIRKELEAALADVALAEQRQAWNFSENQQALTILEDEAERFKIRLAMLVDTERCKDVDIDDI